MKIWLLTTEYPPFFGGGIGTFSAQAVQAYVQARQKVLVITPHSGSQPELEKLGPYLSIYRFAAPSADLEKRKPLEYWRQISRLFHQACQTIIEQGLAELPDIIEGQDYNGPLYDLLWDKQFNSQSLFRQTPIVLTLHATTFQLSQINHAQKWQRFNIFISRREKACLYFADQLFVPSLFLQKQLQRQFSQLKTQLVYSPFQKIGSRKLLRKPPGHEPFHYLYLGRLEYCKGVLELVAIFDQYWQTQPQTKLTLVGADTFFEPAGQSLKQILTQEYAARLKTGQLEILDQQPLAKLTRLRSRVSAQIIPSYFENYPYVAVEAITDQLPLIVSQSGGQAELINEKYQTGWTFDWQKKDDLLVVLQRFESSAPAKIAKTTMRAAARLQKLSRPAFFARQKLLAFQVLLYSPASPPLSFPLKQFYLLQNNFLNQL